MDQAESAPLPGQPERPASPARRWQPRETREKHGLTRARQDRVVRGARDEEQRRDPGPGAEFDHPVIAGYDGSPGSRNALAYAAGLCRRLGRPLLVVHVTPPGAYCNPLTGQIIGAHRDRAETERWLLAELDEVCDRAGIEVRVVTRRGNPARELAAAADDYSADALVIGAPGQRWHHVAGSVSGWLARHAHCPVVVVP
jgi:nucleotide-binding universal stress UspA family protein